jgi:hypothetical protein
MSTVRPSIDTRTPCKAELSTAAAAGAPGVGVGGGAAAAWMLVSQVYAGSALVISSSTCGQMYRSPSIPRMIAISADRESRTRSACRFWATTAS